MSFKIFCGVLNNILIFTMQIKRLGKLSNFTKASHKHSKRSSFNSKCYNQIIKLLYVMSSPKYKPSFTYNLPLGGVNEMNLRTKSVQIVSESFRGVQWTGWNDSLKRSYSKEWVIHKTENVTSILNLHDHVKEKESQDFDPKICCSLHKGGIVIVSDSVGESSF